MITAETQAALNSPAALTRRDACFAKLTDMYAGKAFPDGLYMHGHEPMTQSIDSNWEQWLDESLTSLAEKVGEATDETMLRPLCMIFNPRGVHHVDHMFGADVFDLDDEDNWQCRTLDTPVGELAPVDLASDQQWQMMQDFTQAFLARDMRSVLFSLPTIASVLNIAVNLYGERILIAMHEAPLAARRDLKIINDLLCEMHRWYIATLPAEQLQPICPGARCQPPGFGQLCGCTTQLLSPGMYRDFIAPLDDELLSVYPNGGMIHLCGAHTQHIPIWREMKSLRSLQFNDRASEDLQTYFSELRDDQAYYIFPTDYMTPERILRITGGRRVVITGERSCTCDECAQ